MQQYGFSVMGLYRIFLQKHIKRRTPAANFCRLVDWQVVV